MLRVPFPRTALTVLRFALTDKISVTLICRGLCRLMLTTASVGVFTWPCVCPLMMIAKISSNPKVLVTLLHQEQNCYEQIVSVFCAMRFVSWICVKF